MNFRKIFTSIIFIVGLQHTYASTWYLEKDDTLTNEDIPELSIHTVNGIFVFYINGKKLPLAQKGILAPATASAALIDSTVRNDTICIEAVMGANGKEQDIRNIYIIHKKAKVTAFRTKRSHVTCESELKKR